MEPSHEAPMLAEEVAAGELPPLEERIPANPRLIDTPDGIGTYGGTLNILDAQSRLSLGLRIRHTGLFNYDMSASHYEPDLAESWEWNDDYSSLTIKLRDGLHWSDGDDFTTEDIAFMWDYVRNDPDVSPNGPGGFWIMDGEPATLTIIDDTTFTYTWPRPNPVAMDRFGRTHFSGDNELFLPAHWMKQFHPAFVDKDKLNAMAEAEGFVTDDASEAWVKLFNLKRAQGYNGASWDVTRPVMGIWVPIEVNSDSLLLERNPYFHHVDSEGNQLPYIDYLKITAVPDPELYNLKITSGESDFAIWFTQFSKMELYKANEESGNYTTYVAKSLNPANEAVFFNQTVKDDVKRELFQNKDFRVALSMAMNRDHMNDVMYFGLAERHPPAPLKTMPWYDDSFMNEYLDYSPDKANELLDGLGLTERDSEGYRLMSNGERLTIFLTMSASDNPTFCELLTGDWKEVGVEAQCKPTDDTEVGLANEANELEAVIWNIGRGTLFGRGTPDNWAFDDVDRNYWAPMYSLWNISGGKDGIEPPQEIKDQIALYAEWSQYPSDSPEAAEIGKKYFSFFPDNFWFYPGPGTSPNAELVANRIKNFPKEELYFGSDNNMFAPYHLDAWYIAE